MRDRQCALNHDATESAPIVSGVINKPTTVTTLLCVSVFLAERRVLCPPVMPPFLSCQVVLYVVCVPCCSISNCRVLCTPGAKMLQRSGTMSVWPSTFVHKLCKISTKLQYLWGVLFVLYFLFQHLGFQLM